jgi:hypothetical protein
MITAFNYESFELNKNLSDSGLQVFRPIEERNDVFDKLASTLPPHPGVSTNAPHDFIEPSLIEPLSIELVSFKLSPIELSSIKTISSPSNTKRSHIANLGQQLRGKSAGLENAKSEIQA